MTTGRFAQRGWAFQGWAFRTWGLAGADDGGTFTEYQFSPSRRLTGTRTLMKATGTATTAINLTGTTAKTLTIEGPAR